MQVFANHAARAPTSRIAAMFAALMLIVGVSFPTTQAPAQEPSPQPVMAQQISRDQVVKTLGSRYGEAPVARGLTDTGWMMEVFATPNGDTWTMVLTSPKGFSRVASTGVAWQDVTPPLGKLSNYDLSN